MPTTAMALARKVDSIIHVLRGQRVILDSDLAELYGVPVKHLNQQIKRNARRFPPDFLFQLSRAEHANLRSQLVTSSSDHGGRRYLPHAFTEHGAVMAANVLNSMRAIKMSIFVVRAFVRMRKFLPRTNSSWQNFPSLKGAWKVMTPTFRTCSTPFANSRPRFLQTIALLDSNSLLARQKGVRSYTECDSDDGHREPDGFIIMVPFYL